MEKTDKTLWRIYFWVLILLSAPYYIKPDLKITEMIDGVLFVIALVGLYGYCWYKKILSKDFWRIFFVVAIGWNIFDLFTNPKGTEVMGEDFIAGLFAIAFAVAFFIPLFIALYRYAFYKKARE